MGAIIGTLHCMPHSNAVSSYTVNLVGVGHTQCGSAVVAQWHWQCSGTVCVRA